MGAKSTVKLRKRGVAYKCSHCGRKLMSADALVAHQRTAHNIITKRRGRPVVVSKPLKLGKSFLRERLEAEVKPARRESERTIDETKMKNAVEFECPKCFKKFPTLFPARKHIQKYHCVNKQNIAVPPHDPNLITPLRVELCTKCMCKVESIDTHICCVILPNIQDKGRLCVCAACEEWFPNLSTFDLHIVSNHSDYVESMFFPTNIDFTQWKLDMEQQTKASYGTLEKYVSKWYYHCNVKGKDHVNRNSSNEICPSIIIVQEFPKGIQVHFYHKHYNHSAQDYELSHKYKKYSISSFLKRADEYNSLGQLKPDDDDLYMQFKSLMEGIIVDAAKINIETLKVILGKALEITSILSNYDEEVEDVPINESAQVLSDDQIVKALEEPPAKRKMIEPGCISAVPTSDLLKTKHDGSEVETILSDLPEKKLKLDTTVDDNENQVESLKIVNSFSLADAFQQCKLNINQNIDEKPSDETKEDKDENNLQVNGEPSSFNDSYKDFVVKNFPNMETIARKTRGRPVIKTRIGQFKPSAHSPKVDGSTKSPPSATKVDNKIKAIPIATKSDDKSKPLLNPNKVEEKIKLIPIVPKTYGKTKSQISITKVDEKSKTQTVPAKIDEITKPTIKLVKDTRLRRGNGKVDTVSSTVDEKTKTAVAFSTKIVDDKTKVLPRLEVKVDADSKKSHVTRAKSQNSKVTAKAKSISKVNSRTSFDKPKVDFEYEVKEREDDCNILILKI